jgi:2-aminoethylphosphonate-pyruvate transaminase
MPEHINDSKSFLLTPGPVTLSEKVKAALSSDIIFHRYAAFESLFEQTCLLLKTAMDSTPDHKIVVLSGSGTLANEAAISTVFNSQDRLLMISNGDFGNRLITMAEMHSIPHSKLQYDWGEEINVKEAEELLQLQSYSGIVMVGLETSTGMRNPLAEIGELSKKYKTLFFVDAVSALGSENVSVEQNHIDICTTVPNKGIGGPPGLSIVALSPDAVVSATRNKGKSMYLDLNRYLEIAQKKQTPTTPAISLFFGLKAALEELLEETIERRINRFCKNTAMILEKLTTYDIVPFVKNRAARSNAVLTLSFPKYVDIIEMHNYFLDSGITLWKPLHPGPLKPYNCMQVSVMGSIDTPQISRFLNVFTTYMKSLEIGVEHP